MHNRFIKLTAAAARAAVLLVFCWTMTFASALAGTGVDTWTAAVTPVHVQSQDVGGNLVIYIATAEPIVVNPYPCPVTDEYAVNDTVITHEVLAEALAAQSSGAQIQLYISAEQCVGNRPTILSIVVL